ncbi:unnamed protein product [Cuscuta epithymum]|uniref:Uncharacterized protein n=1 Tax=Cuscuta epithymum TaxID=186058 RepID=A0AAV0DML4_9ASTE|nr:unnamed protein product [Cuscuta epithymum]CAH9142070.1 unnamed protein product [Cuscuta epithymum]
MKMDILLEGCHKI